ncbi:MAG TPA: MFS transporter, partial [Candidatus Thermoplasmatota archaeon]|nr:MFS transporter [Candidatus Thermoplasmatota archaeon]
FALALGATDLEIGLIAAIPFLAQLAHVPALVLISRERERRRLTVVCAALSRALFLAMALLPLLSLPLRPVHALVPLLVAYALLATVAGASWQVWVRELVPRDRLGRYFGRRMAFLSATGLVTLLAAGQGIAWIQRERPDLEGPAFATLFALGALAGFASAAILARAPSLPVSTRHAPSFPESLKRPFADRNYRRLLVFLAAWGFAANVALPFVSVVLLRTLGYGLGVVALFAALSQLANILGLRLWAPLTDRYGNKPVLGLSASVFLLATLVFAFTPKVEGAAILAAATLAHALWGFALAGLDVASNGIVMKLAPEDEAPGYLASASLVKAMAAGAAPLLAGLAATLLADHSLAIRFAWGSAEGESVVTAIRLAQHDFLFLASVLLGLYATHRLLGFHEEGEATEDAVVRAMRREVTGPTSVAGLRQFAHVASYVVEAAYKFETQLLPDKRR